MIIQTGRHNHGRGCDPKPQLVGISRRAMSNVHYNLPSLAPPIELLQTFQAGRTSEAEYVLRYRDQLAKMDPKQTLKWLVDKAEFMEYTSLTLCCFCGPFEFCHRHLVAEWLAPHVNGTIQETSVGMFLYERIDGRAHYY